MGKKPTKIGEVHPVDLYVGRRVRQRRVELGLSQDQLAKAVHVTFQQIQKYEQGVNRVSASKLFEISIVLNAPVGYFFSGVEPATTSPSRDAISVAAYRRPSVVAEPSHRVLNRPETLLLVGSYYQINDRPLRRKVLALVQSLGRSPAA